jgi:serine/threonine protein kinase
MFGSQSWPARGSSIDRRADIWAFGCVLYECLPGKQAFGGGTGPRETVAEIALADPVHA